MLMGVQYGQMKDGLLRVLQVATVIFDGLPQLRLRPRRAGASHSRPEIFDGRGEGARSFLMVAPKGTESALAWFLRACPGRSGGEKWSRI